MGRDSDLTEGKGGNRGKLMGEKLWDILLVLVLLLVPKNRRKTEDENDDEDEVSVFGPAQLCSLCFPQSNPAHCDGRTWPWMEQVGDTITAPKLY
jgi:hypothetical protein